MDSKKKNRLYFLWTDKTTTVEDICKCVGPGWTPLIKDLIKSLWDIKWDGGLYQVKEKFGGLRFYINATPEQFKLVMAAEAKSFKTCEECGERGKTRGDGWIRTLCEKCYDKTKRDMAKD